MKHQDIINQMTLEQKAAIVSGKTTWETYAFPSAGVPSIFLADGPHGLRKQEGAGDHLGLNQSVKATCFPTAATLANSWDEELCASVGAAIGHEAAAHDVHVLLGPGLNIKRNPLCGRNFEYYSEDPILAGKLAASFIRGVQSQGVAACPKHFAVNSQENRRMASDSIVDERTLREIYTTGFEIAVKEGKPKSIMSSYNKVNGIYANEHPELLKKMLRQEWGFDGFVVSDWGGDNNRIAAVQNGSNLAMPSMGLVGQREIIEAVQNGTLSEEDLNQRVDELLDVVLELNTSLTKEPVDYKSHHELAKTAAAKSLVLLKNEDHILPLNKGTKVAVIGDFATNPRYQGAGSSLVNPTEVNNFTECVQASNLEVVGVVKGYERTDVADEALITEALQVAKEADVVLLYLGLDEISESEGLDRRTLSLPKNQLALLRELTKVHDRIVVLMAAGSVVEMNWDTDVKAILHGYLNGQAGAQAMVEALVGDVNPSGKLAETVPFALEDIPSSSDFPAMGAYAIYREGIYVGYRYFDKVQKAVKYPFGYGLSYTEFDYSNLQVDENGVRVTVTNTGTVEGSEVVQLYVSLPTSRIFRATKELKAFAKVTLAPGEAKEVTLPFTEQTFRYFDAQKDEWQVEAGEYLLQVGASVEDIRLTAQWAVDGVTFPEKQQEFLSSYWSGDVLEVTDEEFGQLLGRPVPEDTWFKGQELTAEDPVSKLRYAKGALARLACSILERQLKKAEKKGKPDLNLLFLYNMPIRALAKMTNGAVDMPMVQGILQIVNGHFFKGVGTTWKAFRLNRRHQKNVVL